MPDDVAVKWDEEKARTDLLPPRPLMDIAEVFTFGAKKYSDRNWENGFRYGRPFAALLRHLFAWWRGENNDTETGLSHLAHAGCCLLMLMEFRHSHRGEDDRPKFDKYFCPHTPACEGDEAFCRSRTTTVTHLCSAVYAHEPHHASGGASGEFDCPGVLAK